MFDHKINLPTELIQELAIKFLDPKSVFSASKVSKSWNSFFTHPTIWKNKLIQDFGIDSNFLSELHISEDNQFLYKQMYTQAAIFALHRHLPGFIQTIYKDRTSNYLLLLACLDNITAFEHVVVEEQYSLVVLSIYTGGFHIPVHFLQNRNKEEKLLKSLLNHSLMSGNIRLVQYLLSPNNQFELILDLKTLDNVALSGNLQSVLYLLNPENQFALKPDQDTLAHAAYSGNLQLVQYLLNPENPFELKPDQDMLICAAQSGNLQLVQYLLNPENQFALTPDQNMLGYSARSSNLDLAQWLLNPENQYALKPDQDTLTEAALSGNLQFVQYLLNPEYQLGLKPNQHTIIDAALSGNLQLVQYLLNPANQFELKPNQKTLNDAALSGNLQLVQYLLNDQFALKPDEDTLDYAAQSGNLKLVQYLLHPVNQFGLEPNQDILNKAVESGNFGLSEHLLPSHIAMQEALQELKSDNFDSARESLQKSQIACPNHYKLLSDYYLNNAKLFKLNDEAIHLLEDLENNSSMFGLMYKA